MLSTKVEDRHWVGIMCAVCDVDTWLRGAVLICAIAQPAADLVKYKVNIISRGQCKLISWLQNKVDGHSQVSCVRTSTYI